MKPTSYDQPGKKTGGMEDTFKKHTTNIPPQGRETGQFTPGKDKGQGQQPGQKKPDKERGY